MRREEIAARLTRKNGTGIALNSLLQQYVKQAILPNSNQESGGDPSIVFDRQETRGTCCSKDIFPDICEHQFVDYFAFSNILYTLPSIIPSDTKVVYNYIYF